MVLFQRNPYFSKDSAGSNIFVGVQLFPGGGGGFQMLISKENHITVMSPNIARPLTLRTSPSDYATFNQIKSFFIFSIRLLLEREKQQKIFTLSFHC